MVGQEGGELHDLVADILVPWRIEVGGLRVVAAIVWSGGDKNGPPSFVLNVVDANLGVHSFVPSVRELSLLDIVDVKLTGLLCARVDPRRALFRMATVCNFFLFKKLGSYEEEDLQDKISLVVEDTDLPAIGHGAKLVLCLVKGRLNLSFHKKKKKKKK